jgi:dolichyl-phosphate beta-glucosyltransferase
MIIQDSEKGSNLDSKVIYLVVPCYNEEKRWKKDYWSEILELPNLIVCFVNDGSSDNTSVLISNQIKGLNHIFLDFDKNRGKAEAVRLGLLKSLEDNPYAIGYLDADAAFPVRDVANQMKVFWKFAVNSEYPVSIWSSRVRLAGRSIERNAKRHYMSRVIATYLSLILKFTIYDTQSGLKIFPTTDCLREALEKPFQTRWFLDLEIYLRWRNLNDSEARVWEEPLEGWNDVEGSKLTGKQYLNVIRDLWKLRLYR